MNIENYIGLPNVTIAVNPDDLQEFALYVIKKVSEELVKAKETVEEKYLTSDETAKMLGVSTNTLWRWNKIGYLRHVKVGRKSLYLLSEVEKLLMGNDK